MNAQTKHTPGNWVTNGFVVSVRLGNSQRIICELSTSAPSRGKTYLIDSHRAELMANARLIAVAPELLEDLQEAAAEARCGCEHPACRRCERDKRWAKTIAKATGEQP